MYSDGSISKNVWRTNGNNQQNQELLVCREANTAVLNMKQDMDSLWCDSENRKEFSVRLFFEPV